MYLIMLDISCLVLPLAWEFGEEEASRSIQNPLSIEGTKRRRKSVLRLGIRNGGIFGVGIGSCGFKLSAAKKQRAIELS